MTLYCAYCRCGQEVGEEIRSCQRCGSLHFTTARPGRKSPTAWTVNDRRFLHSLRIKSDEPEAS